MKLTGPFSAPKRPGAGRSGLGLIAAWLVLLFVQGATGAQPQWPNLAPATERALAGGEAADVIIRLAPDAALPAGAALAEAQDHLLASLAEAPGWTLRHRYASIPYVTGQITPQALAALAGHPAVEWVGPDLRVKGALVESTAAIRADSARTRFQLSGTGVAVGLIDTGIDLNHPDLAGALLAGRRFIKDDPTAATVIQDDHGHGTHLAGILTSDALGPAPLGIAPGCRLVVVKALDANNQGWASDIIAAIDWIVSNRALFPTLKFINLSIVFDTNRTTLCPCDSLALLDANPDRRSSYGAFIEAVGRARDAGILIVAPSGNGGGQGLNPPSCFENVVAVGAAFDGAYTRAPTTGTYYTQSQSAYFADVHDEFTQIRRLTGFSNYGDCLALLAPGYSIRSTMLGGTTRNSFGTSMAAAHVTAALALLQERAPALTAGQLVGVLRQSGRPVPSPANPAISYMLIDVDAAVILARRTSAQSWTMFK